MAEGIIQQALRELNEEMEKIKVEREDLENFYRNMIGVLAVRELSARHMMGVIKAELGEVENDN